MHRLPTVVATFAVRNAVLALGYGVLGTITARRMLLDALDR